MGKPIYMIIFEAVIVGLLLIPFAYLAGFFALLLVGKPSLPEVCSKWNDNHIMEINLFIAGFLFHIVMQLTGVNEWYARNYCNKYGVN